MTKHAPVSLALAALLALLAGCSSQPTCGNTHPYADSRAGTPLQAPAGVTLPAPDAAYVIPVPKGGAASAQTAGSCMIKPPDVLGPLGAPAAVSAMTPTISRHRHGKTYEVAKPAPQPVTAPAASTRASPGATSPAPAASTHGAPVAGGGSLE
ncbi:MAG TPA: hypothetical protein VGV16_04905 [Gammaproteobacteria bacterium]|nr:hypothetical protein [Gammaproteobacteria bacterium]